MQTNPFITYLNRYTTISSDHEGAFDEFIAQATPPEHPLRLETSIEQYVRKHFTSPHPPSIILTGNAGDGKTYLARQIIHAITNTAITTWKQVDCRIEYGEQHLRVVKDLSELSETEGEAILIELAQILEEENSHESFLIAANEGRLRALLSRNSLQVLEGEIDRQLRQGTELDNSRLIVLNLNEITTSTYVPQVLQWITQPSHWTSCDGCPAQDSCPIHYNAKRLAEPLAIQQLQKLYFVLEQLGTHITVRDMLIHLAYTVTAGLNCTQVKQQKDLTWAHRYIYYENVWAMMADETFVRKALVVNQLRRINVGEVSVFAVDDFVVNGRVKSKDNEIEWKKVFVPAIDLAGKLFQQDRADYLYSGASSPQPHKIHRLMEWLPHCRRKLFFEWDNEEVINKLFPFLYLPTYFRLIGGDKVLLEKYKGEIILGLNRVFSGLFLIERDTLYITSQYSETVEQPVPIVKFDLGSNHISLVVEVPSKQAYDNELMTLKIEIWPPPQVDSPKISWKIDLLRFEYLMRRANGGTSDILDEECELAVRQLKDQLLSQFYQEDVSTNRIMFFADASAGYGLRSLWIDGQGKIRS